MIKNNKKLQKEAQKEYQNLSEEEKQKRQKKALGRYRKKIVNIIGIEKKNLSEEEKQEKVAHMKSYYLAHNI